MNSLVLYVPYFKASSSMRQAELDHCVQKNLAINSISKIYLLIDDGSRPPFKDGRLVFVDVPSRPTYQDWIRYSYHNDKNKISLLANADIYFEDDLSAVIKTLQSPLKFLALTRYDLKQGKVVPHPVPKWSQDVWGVNTASPLNQELYKALDFMLGVPRCDNKVAYVFSIYGWRVANPMHAVKSIHVHESEERTYNKKTDVRILGGVAYVEPTVPGESHSVLEYDIYARSANRVRSAVLSKVIDKLTSEEWTENQVYVTSSQMQTVHSHLPASTGANGLSWHSEGKAGEWFEQLAKEGAVVKIFGRFILQRLDQEVLFKDALYPQRLLTRPVTEILASGLNGFAEHVLERFIPAIFNPEPFQFSETGIAGDKISFWQYPCTTELQALNNHLQKSEGLTRIDPKRRIVQIYLGLPWATFTDRKFIPDYVEKIFAVRLNGFHLLAQMCGYQLRVHTVCQTIHWHRLIPCMQACGVTDLHISHLEAQSEKLLPANSTMRLHAWHLIATNVEIPGRDIGIVYSKPIAEKKWLASFTGAHMNHYRSDVRLKLKAVADSASRPDVYVQLKDEWHFNKIVYKEQVAMEMLSEDEKKAEKDATKTYNELLSESIFSLCPEGAGPNTLRFWESLAVGAIPVVFSDSLRLPAELSNHLKTHVVIPVEDINKVFEVLENYTELELLNMQKSGVEVYQKIRSRVCF